MAFAIPRHHIKSPTSQIPRPSPNKKQSNAATSEVKAKASIRTKRADTGKTNIPKVINIRQENRYYLNKIYALGEENERLQAALRDQTGIKGECLEALILTIDQLVNRDNDDFEWQEISSKICALDPRLKTAFDKLEGKQESTPWHSQRSEDAKVSSQPIANIHSRRLSPPPRARAACSNTVPQLPVEEAANQEGQSEKYDEKSLSVAELSQALEQNAQPVPISSLVAPSMSWAMKKAPPQPPKRLSIPKKEVQEESEDYCLPIAVSVIE